MSIETIGYGNRTIEDFVDLLNQSESEYLIDVRSRPYSKFQPAFSKETLKTILTNNQFNYLFMGDELGGTPDDKSCYFENGKVNYEMCRQRLEYQKAIERLLIAEQKSYNLMLMCSELSPQSCHRCKLISEDLEKNGIDVVHVDKDGSKVSHKTVLQRLTGGQMNLFGSDEHLNSSRKKYD